MRIQINFLVFGFVVSSVAGCNDRTTTEECYISDPNGDYDGPAHQVPFCQWGPVKPEAPEGLAAYRAAACVPVASGEACDACDVERIDALVKEEIASECCEPIEEFLRGCYWKKTLTDGSEECCYGAYYFSACTEPAVGQECRQNGSG